MDHLLSQKSQLSDINIFQKYFWLVFLLFLPILIPIAPVAAATAERFGKRNAAFLGGWLAFVGITVCSFAESYLLIFASIGVLTGRSDDHDDEKTTFSSCTP